MGPTATLLQLFCIDRPAPISLFVALNSKFVVQSIVSRKQELPAYRADILYLPTLMYVALEFVALCVQHALGTSLQTIANRVMTSSWYTPGARSSRVNNYNEVGLAYHLA